MEILDLICGECGKSFTGAEMPRRGLVCFSCHVRSIRLGFRYGKDNFHGPTIRERQEKIISDAKINGSNPVPASEYGF